MNKLQIMSINILNSKYRVIFTLALYFIIYSFFYSDSITYCMRGNNIPAIAESKDEIIRNLQKQVNDLTIERDFLRKNIAEITKESFEAKHEHLNILQKMQEDLSDLRLKNILNEPYKQNFLPQAEPILEAHNVERDYDLLRLKEENKMLQAELKQTKSENVDLRAELKIPAVSDSIFGRDATVRNRPHRMTLDGITRDIEQILQWRGR